MLVEIEMERRLFTAMTCFGELENSLETLVIANIYPVYGEVIAPKRREMIKTIYESSACSKEFILCLMPKHPKKTYRDCPELIIKHL